MNLTDERKAEIGAHFVSTMAARGVDVEVESVLLTSSTNDQGATTEQVTVTVVGPTGNRVAIDLESDTTDFDAEHAHELLAPPPPASA